MKKISLVFYSIILTFIAHSQSFEWVKTHLPNYNLNPEMINTAVASDNAENAYFFGIADFHITYGSISLGDLFIKKYNSEGSVQWAKSIMGDASVSGVICNNAGDMYLYGQTKSELDFWGEYQLYYDENQLNLFLAKVSSSGALIWAKNMSIDYVNYHTFSVPTIYEEGIIIGIGNWMNSLVLTFSPEGLLADSLLQENVSHISSVELDNDGNIYVSGSCSGLESKFGGQPFPTDLSYSNYIAKYNANSEAVWVKFIEDVTCESPRLKIDQQGNIYMSGSLHMDSYFGDIHANGPSWVYDFFLTKLDSNGNFLWLKEVPEVLSGDAGLGGINYMDINENGNIVLCGLTRKTVQWEENIVSNVEGNSTDIIILEYDQNGEIQYAKTAGGEFYDRAKSISSTVNGNLYIAGTVAKTAYFDTISVQSDEYAYPFIAKLNNQNITSINSNTLENKLRIYPNPASDFIKIEGSTNSLFDVVDIYGKVVKQINGNAEHIDVYDLNSGIYFVVNKQDNGNNNYLKFIKK